MSTLSRWLSEPRFAEYLVAANHDQESARRLYEWNAAISAGFFELISYVEVGLRNALDSVLAPLEVTHSARIDASRGWWFASSTFLEDEALKYHETARRHLGKKSPTASRDQVLASMTFGLWEAIFGPKYENLFRKHLVHAFPGRPQGFTRKTVHTRVLALRNLRNRIAHHQAIFDLPLEERYEQIMDLLGWLDPALRNWVGGISRVPDLLDERPSAAEAITLVVPAKDAWPFYQQHGVYVCQPGRFFQHVSHLGFYAHKAIQREIPKILSRIDDVPWTPEEVGRLMGTHSQEDRRLAEVIKAARASIWTEDRYQVFFLTRPDIAGSKQGHITLDSELPNLRSGRGSAWVQRQRYVAVSALRTARTLAELDQQ